jgi:hypothetical protein
MGRREACLRPPPLITFTHLKKVFWLHRRVGARFQILDNQPVACALKIGSASTWNQNPIFETGSTQVAG